MYKGDQNVMIKGGREAGGGERVSGDWGRKGSGRGRKGWGAVGEVALHSSLERRSLPKAEGMGDFMNRRRHLFLELSRVGGDVVRSEVGLPSKRATVLV
jgi:hypothetical protein